MTASERLGALTGADWDELRGLVDRVDAHDGAYGEWARPKKNEDGTVSFGYAVNGPLISDVVRFLYGKDLLLNGFIWPEWDEGQRAIGDKDVATVAQSSPEDALRYITFMLRADRFSEGALLGFFGDGLMPAVLRRALDFAPDTDRRRR